MNHKQKPCRLSTQEQNRIVFLYKEKHLSANQIAHQTHHKHSTVTKVLRDHGYALELGLPLYTPSDEEVATVTAIINNNGSIKNAAKAINKNPEIIKRIIKQHGLNYDYRPHNPDSRCYHLSKAEIR